MFDFSPETIRNEPLWRVVVYNDDSHSFEEAMQAIQEALPMELPKDKLSLIIQDIDTYGKAMVSFCFEEEMAQEIAQKVRNYGFLVEIDDAENMYARQIRKFLLQQIEEGGFGMEEGEEWKRGL